MTVELPCGIEKEMIITYSRNDPYTIIRIHDVITPDSDFSCVENEIRRLFAQGIVHIGIELADGSMLSSRAIGVLVRSTVFLSKNGGSFIVIDPSNNIEKLFRLLGLHCCLLISNTPDSCPQAVGQYYNLHAHAG